MFAQVLPLREGQHSWPAGSAHQATAVDLVLYFGSRAQLSDGAKHGELQDKFSRAIICGCSTGGQISGNSVVDDAVVALGFVFEKTTLLLATADLTDSTGSRVAGETLGRALAGKDDLAGVFVLADGLNVDGNELIAGLHQTLGCDAPITGGMACDGTAFEKTLVAAGVSPRPNVVAAIGFYGAAFRMGSGIGAGWQVFGPHRSVTRSSGSRVHEVDGAPILDLYRRYLGDEDFAGLPTTGLRYPLQLSRPFSPGEKVIRAVLGVDHVDGSMMFGGAIPVGSVVQLMRGNFERLADAAGRAAQAVRDEVAGEDPHATAAVLVSCVGRRILMGSNTEDEVAAVTDELTDDVPRIGFYSLGEIAPFPGSLCSGLHNQTMTIVTFSETLDSTHA